MNISEQIAIMKHETRLANRTTGDGLKNWTPEARAKSLAVRRAKGSVWGWDKRPRGSAESLSPGFDRIMEEIEKDAPRVRRIRELHASGTPTIGPRDKYADELAAQQLESFKAWLAEVKRVEGAIDDFNGTVAAIGGLNSGAGMGKGGKAFRRGYATPGAGAADKKVDAIEKSIRRNFEKRNDAYLRKNPEERPVMLDMVAEKAEYYSAQPARKVEIEKEAYRRIRDEGISSMREASDYAAEFKTALETKRSYVRERDAVKPQLHIDEVAYPVGNGRWVAQMPDGSERVINASPAPVVLKLKTPGPAPKKTGKLIEDSDWADMLQDGRYLIGGRYFDHVANRSATEAEEDDPVENRHTSACAKSRSEKCNCSCGGAQHGTESSGDDTADLPKEEEPPKEGKEATPPATDPEASDAFDAWVTYFKKVIELGEKPNVAELRKGNADNPKKFKVAYAALAEAWHTYSLDQFQDKFERDPKRNFEFRMFQKKIGVPPEFIGGK